MGFVNNCTRNPFKIEKVNDEMSAKLDVTTGGVATAAATSPLYMSDMQNSLSNISHVASDLLPILGVVIALGQIGYFVYSKILNPPKK